MSAADRHPSRDELLAMAYVDDELDPAERARFEARLADEPRLALRVSPAAFHCACPRARHPTGMPAVPRA